MPSPKLGAKTTGISELRGTQSYEKNPGKEESPTAAPVVSSDFVFYSACYILFIDFVLLHYYHYVLVAVGGACFMKHDRKNAAAFATNYKRQTQLMNEGHVARHRQGNTKKPTWSCFSLYSSGV